MATVRILALLLISPLLIGTLLPCGESGQDQKTSDEGFKIRANVALVTMDVTVIGEHVPELRAEDFVIYDNKIAQQISYFSQDQLPIDVAILVDISGSIQKHFFELQIAALSALRRLKADDRIALYAFARSYKRISNLSEDRLHIAKMIGDLRVFPFGTDVYGTLYDAALYLKKNAPNRRHSIILISDNCHYNGDIDADRSRTELLEAAATLYNIVTLSEQTEGPICLESNPIIRSFAEETGGEVMEVQGSMSLKDALEQAISRIRTQYTLGFNPSNLGSTGSFHELAVRLTNKDRCPNCQIKARKGYYAGISPPFNPPQSATIKPSHSSEAIDQKMVQRSIAIAGSDKGDLDQISFGFSTAEQMESNGQRQLKIDLQIDVPEIESAKIRNPHQLKLFVTIFYADKKYKIFGSDWWTIEGQPGEVNAPIPFSKTISLKPNYQILRVVIYDDGSGKMGSKIIDLHNKK